MPVMMTAMRSKRKRLVMIMCGMSLRAGDIGGFLVVSPPSALERSKSNSKGICMIHTICGTRHRDRKTLRALVVIHE
jgi:hypothetical protein